MLVIKIQDNAEDIDTFPTSEKDVTEEKTSEVSTSFFDGTFFHFRRDFQAVRMF